MRTLEYSELSVKIIKETLCKYLTKIDKHVSYIATFRYLMSILTSTFYRIVIMLWSSARLRKKKTPTKPNVEK